MVSDLNNRENLYLRVRVAFVAQGTSLHAWCRENGVAMPNARAAILGTPAEFPDPVNETDHEFRLRMSREGKAIYVPGKTEDEIRFAQAEKAAQRSEPRSLTIELNDEQLDLLDLALPDACELVWDAAHIFQFLESGLASGRLDPEDMGIRSIMRMAGRTLMRAESHELAALELIDQKVRAARGLLNNEGIA